MTGNMLTIRQESASGCELIHLCSTCHASIRVSANWNNIYAQDKGGFFPCNHVRIEAILWRRHLDSLGPSVEVRSFVIPSMRYVDTTHIRFLAASSFVV